MRRLTPARWVWSETSWFRIHLCVFTLLPIVFSGFFVAANPSPASGLVTGYLDALFMCFSAMTVCGLNVVSVSELQPAQQGFLFVLMLVGDISIVNVVTIVCRQSWFLLRCRRVVDYPLRASRERQGAVHKHNGYRQSDVSDATRKDARPSPWEDDLKRRHAQRVRNGADSNDLHQHPRDPYGHVPHASSGQKVHAGRGGFPNPVVVGWNMLSWLFPRTTAEISAALRRSDVESVHSPHIVRKLEAAVKDALSSHKDEKEQQRAKRVRWLPAQLCSVVVGRNSQFFEEEMQDDDLRVLGALEYRATRLLSVLLIGHVLFWILVPSAILAVYFYEIGFWDASFVANGGTQSGTVNKTWFAFFQVVCGQRYGSRLMPAAYSSCGLSLVDTGMVPFDNCYLLIYVLILPMLAGNQALPLFLRLEIWVLSKVFRDGGEMEVTLSFILAHSRRFFLYLFPAYQTWWLTGIEAVLGIIGTALFVLYNRGVEYYESLGDAWDKFSIALFASWATRASGFQIVALDSLAPATNMLFLMLIFTSNYPLVMAIRSTNVYEERALGLHGEHAPGKHNEQMQERGEIFSKYLKHHLLPQIYFDLWPIAIGTMLICVAERGLILNPDNVAWLDVFKVLFEAASGYGTIGLSFGNPFNTSSLSAGFGVVSKLIIILLMLRGRHRGLPLAIDRATMFPVEYLRFTKGQRDDIESERVNEAGEAADQE